PDVGSCRIGVTWSHLLMLQVAFCRPSLTIEELAASKRWALNGGPFGSKLVSRMYVDAGVPVIRGCNLPMDKRFDESEFVFVSEEKADDLRQHIAVPGDLVFTQRGTLGQVGLIPPDATY